MFSLICAWINASVNNREAGDLRRHRTHYDVIVMGFHLVEIPGWLLYVMNLGSYFVRLFFVCTACTVYILNLYCVYWPIGQSCRFWIQVWIKNILFHSNSLWISPWKLVTEYHEVNNNKVAMSGQFCIIWCWTANGAVVLLTPCYGIHTMMSSNGNIFLVTSPVIGEFPVQRPLTLICALNKRLRK